MSSNPKGSTQTTGKAGKNADNKTENSEASARNQATAQGRPLNSQQSDQTSNRNQKSNEQRFGRESWNEFSPKRKDSEFEDQSLWRRQKPLRDFYDQARRTHEWEQRQEREYSEPHRQMNPWFDDRSRGQFREREPERYGRESRYNQPGRNQWRSDWDRGDYERGRSDYRDDYNQSASQREWRSGRDRSDEYQRGRNQQYAQRGPGQGERGERMPGGHGPAVSGRDYETHRGNRETSGEHRYGGRPERDYEQSRYGRSQTQGDREGDYADRDYQEGNRQSGYRDRQNPRQQNAAPRRGRRDQSDWSRDRISDSYNTGRYDRQDRPRNEDLQEEESDESLRDRNNPIH